MPGSRSPDIRRVRISTAYSVDEIARLLGVHSNTVRRWLGDGLAPMDKVTPILIHGSELRRFLSNRRKVRRQRCRPDEFHCFRCRAPRKAATGSVSVASSNLVSLQLRGICMACDGPIWRAGSFTKLAEYAATFGFAVTEIPRLGERRVSLVDGDLKEDETDGAN